MTWSWLALGLALTGCPGPRMNVLVYGDSKSVNSISVSADVFKVDMQRDLGCSVVFDMQTPTAPGAAQSKDDWGWLARSGYTTADMQALIDADLLETFGGPPEAIIYNLGSNDAFFGDTDPGNEATWKANTLYIWDAMHTKWPSAHIYATYAWRQGYDTECDRMAGWLDDVIALRSSFVSVCDDERVWAKGDDDGATMFFDGVHVSTIGALTEARLKEACLGF